MPTRRAWRSAGRAVAKSRGCARRSWGKFRTAGHGCPRARVAERRVGAQWLVALDGWRGGGALRGPALPPGRLGRARRAIAERAAPRDLSRVARLAAAPAAGTGVFSQSGLPTKGKCRECARRVLRRRPAPVTLSFSGSTLSLFSGPGKRGVTTVTPFASLDANSNGTGWLDWRCGEFTLALRPGASDATKGNQVLSGPSGRMGLAPCQRESIRESRTGTVTAV